MIVAIPTIICSLAAFAGLASSIAMLAASCLIAKSSFAGCTDSALGRAQEFITGANSMRNALIVLLIVLFVMANDSIYLAGFTRLGACTALCGSYAGTLVPALFITVVSDVACIITRNGNSTLRTLRTTARSFSFWSIVFGLALSFIFYG